MRNVYLTREKSFVACFSTLSVYIEDKENSELEINGVSCHFIGKIKNGETLTFPIGDEAVKVYVIADKLSKDYCSDHYQIPSGENDIEIGGKNVLNPAIGNPFRFHGVADEDVLSERRSTGRRGALVTVLALLLGVILGVIMNMDSLFSKPKTFICDSFEIVLTTAFSDSYEDNIYYFASDDCSVAVYEFEYENHIDIAEMDEQQFLEKLQASGHFLPESEIVSESGLKFIEEEAESVSGDIRSYFTVFVKGDESFYLFEFGCETKEFEEYRASFIEWAESIIIK